MAEKTKTIGIIGGGQLGLMIAEQARELGVRTVCLDPAADAPAFNVCDDHIVAAYDDAAALEELCRRSDAVTYEFENVPGDILIPLCGKYNIPQGYKPLYDSQDRLREKSNARDHGLRTPGFEAVDDEASLREAVRRLGLPAVLRGRSQGHVERAVLENDGHALRGLIVRRGFGGAKWVARDSIALLGDVSVILRACPTHLPRKTDFRLRTVKDTRGLTLGCVTDVLISADNLLVSELAVSLGLIDDFRDGRRRIRHFSASPDGDVLVPEGEILLEGRETQ